MTKEENPHTQERGFPSFLESAKPRASHIPTARLLLHSLHRPSKPTTTVVLLATFLTYPQIPQRRHFSQRNEKE